MKDRDRQHLHLILSTVLANLAYAVAVEAEPLSVGFSLRTAKQKVTRYDRRGFTRLPEILEAIPGPWTVRKSARKGIASAIIPAPMLVDDLLRFRLYSDTFIQETQGRETIYLSRTNRDYVADTKAIDWIDYTDTPATERYRAEMERINAFLAQADLKLAGTPEVITSQRHLRRYFKLSPFARDRQQAQRFDLGGRLFGGWWQNLRRDQRSAIRINGEPITDLDFDSMFLRLAYLDAGIAPPDGDLYASVRLPASRDTVKRLVAAMLFCNSPLARIPPNQRSGLPSRISADTIRGAVFDAHPVSLFEKGSGSRLMFTESQILIAALLRLIDQRIPALPMHDGLMVAQSKSGAALIAMQDAAAKITGHRLPITLK